MGSLWLYCIIKALKSGTIEGEIYSPETGRILDLEKKGHFLNLILNQTKFLSLSRFCIGCGWISAEPVLKQFEPDLKLKFSMNPVTA